MKDYAALLIASALFAFLSPGLVFQMPGKEHPFAFMNMKTSVASMFLHTAGEGKLRQEKDNPHHQLQQYPARDCTETFGAVCGKCNPAQPSKCKTHLG
ncbi:hypothetical protein ACLB2K_057722 [Fragaria x ananassa]